jgi:hypothetical protein
MLVDCTAATPLVLNLVAVGTQVGHLETARVLLVAAASRIWTSNVCAIFTVRWKCCSSI